MQPAGDIREETNAFAIAASELGDDVLADTLAVLAEQIARALDCHECCIYDYIPERDSLRALAIWSRRITPRDREWIGEVHALQEIPDFEQVIQGREVVISYPHDVVDHATSGFKDMQYWGELAAIWAPIIHAGEVLGILELTEKERPRTFTDKEASLVRRMATLAGIALSNARSRRAMEERNRQLTALIDSSRAMISTLDLDEVLDVVCRQVARALEAPCSYIYEYDADRDALVWLAMYHSDPDHVPDDAIGTLYPLEELPVDFSVVQNRHPVQVRVDDPGLHEDDARLLSAWGKRSLLWVPLVMSNGVVGALEVGDPARARSFSREETELCVALGEQAAVAMHNAQLYRRLQQQKDIIEQQAITDDLTGLANHRHFWTRLREETARAHRYGQPLSLLMLDLDDFKQVNDSHGHLFGDEVLRAVGEALRLHVRQGVDIPARYGGEEFAVILPCTDCQEPDGTANGASRTAERIRDAVAALRLPLDGGEWSGLTASIGVATLPRHADTAEDLVLKADTALYEAKQRGKDRVAVHAGA